MHSWIDDIRYILMPASHPTPLYEKEYFAAYEGWRSASEKFRAEIGVKEPLYSDGFVLADEMGLLFYKNEFVGMSSFTYGVLNMGPMQDLSWFKGWSDEAYSKLRSISPNAMIGSQFTVSPQFTGKNQIVRWKEIVFVYTFMRFQHSIADVMAGHLNLTRKVNEACGEDFGATILDPCKTFDYYGVEIPAQLVAYEKANIKILREKMNHGGMCDKLWSKLTHLSDYPVIADSNVIPMAA